MQSYPYKEEKCSVCGSEEHDWSAHMNAITIEKGFGLWERVEGGFICGVCNKISPKATRFCCNCGKWFTGILVPNDEGMPEGT